MWYTLPSTPYSWIKVNVGLDTSSCSATPRPRTIPLASVVLPAPRLPINSTTPRRGNSPASRSPSAKVSSSDALRCLGTLLHRVRKILQQIRGQQALVPERLRAAFPRQSVQVNRRRHRLVGALLELRHQARDEPGEDVAAAALPHRRRAGRVDPYPAVAERDHRALPFEHQRDAMLRGISTRYADAVRLNVRRGFPGQTRHFAGVRGEDAYAGGMAVALPHHALSHQRVGVQYHRPFERLGQPIYHRRDFWRASQPRAHRNHALALRQRFQVGVERDAARFGFR